MPLEYTTVFSKQIVTPEFRSKVIANIQRDGNIPTVLYGAGIYAKEVEKFLQSHSVDVYGYFVDDGYLLADHYCDNRVYSLEQIKSMYVRFNVVIAYCGNHKSTLIKFNELKCQQIVSVRFFDCRFWERFTELNWHYLQNNIDSFQKIYDWFEDGLSKTTFINYINTKLAFDCSNLNDIRSYPQYFPDCLPEFTPSYDDIFIDAGAYTGDTLAAFMTKTKKQGCKKYYAFEPDAYNAQQLSSFICEQNLKFVEVMHCGLWSQPDILRFEGAHQTRSLISDSGKTTIKVESIDRLALGASFIKMDIEGAELEALKGASNQIKKFKPKLAIALYHKPGDLLDIPFFIKSLCPEYKFYLRIHSPMSEELVLYAIV